jgi:DNA-nicking Smr family endonuclease
MSRKSPVSSEESELFRKALKDVERLSQRGKLAPGHKLPSPHPQFSQRDEREVIEHLLDHDIDPESTETGDELSFRQSGVQDGVMRRLRRGQYAVQGELDLHGLTVAPAREAVDRFLKDSRARGRHCVRIIHGKGLRSSNKGPILKTKLSGWLRQRQEVLAFSSARPADGGTGAVYVLLRR